MLSHFMRHGIDADQDVFIGFRATHDSKEARDIDIFRSAFAVRRCRCGSPPVTCSVSPRWDPFFLAVPPLAGVTVLLVLETLKPIWRSTVKTGADSPA
jgi:hypothetical protein